MAVVLETKAQCFVCRKPAGHRCGKCNRVYYCGREHQLNDWMKHKNTCHRLLYEVRESKTLGRHWVAREDIIACETLLIETPLAYGPKAASPPVCLACHVKLRTAIYKCPSCGWPTCDNYPLCGQHHSEAECRLITGHSPFSVDQNFENCFSFSAYCFVLPLRCLLLKGNNNEKFRRLQSHLEARSNTPLYNIYRINLVEFMLDRLGMRTSGLVDKDILETAAILDTNAFEVRYSGGAKMRAVYAEASMLAHNCKPNTKHVFTGNNGEIRLLSTVNIKKGETITATYTQSLWPTFNRRNHLKAAKCFICECERCLDLTEFGTHLSSVVCSGCGDYVTPYQLKCNELCRIEHNWNIYNLKISEIERRIQSLGKNIDLATLEYFLDQKITPLFHSNHFIIVKIKYTLVQMYSIKILDLTICQLENNFKICIELLKLADVLDPGFTRFRGLLFFYIQQGLKRLFQLKPKQNLSNEIESFLQEAKGILKTEPDLAHLVIL
ncbi:SET domain-containing protein SmydA-8-like [Daktulosphaira vitifoliae]|uniref:SET domain-containing protein SmydA-8-like n=1 Tax=Daktulosphaira vitifoliae TaxID=58002 RepID=UPI0021AAC459|nr:SET domain-containing protein SmydA-8-like [Daktulosphaira vitifoliae]